MCVCVSVCKCVIVCARKNHTHTPREREGETDAKRARDERREINLLSTLLSPTSHKHPLILLPLLIPLTPLTPCIES